MAEARRGGGDGEGDGDVDADADARKLEEVSCFFIFISWFPSSLLCFTLYYFRREGDGWVLRDICFQEDIEVMFSILLFVLPARAFFTSKKKKKGTRRTLPSPSAIHDIQTPSLPLNP